MNLIATLRLHLGFSAKLEIWQVSACKMNYEILVMGINPRDHEYISTNTAISIAVQNFIFQTKRFTENMV